MKVLITGAAGQLGHSLVKAVSSRHELITRDMDLDITNPDAVATAMRDIAPGLVINAAAYTAVDRAESEPDQAYAVNAHGPEILANACRMSNTRFIHVSTDFVFDGNKSRPYLTSDQRNPLNVYGASKSAGEDRVTAALGDSATIIRTGWLYAFEGHNFVKTILRLLTQTSELPVIADQVGTPTWAISLAQFIWVLAEREDLHGIFHWSDAGVASWYDFAVAIQEEALGLGILAAAIPIIPVPTEAYPLPATRPPYSVLDKQRAIKSTDSSPNHWRTNLRAMLKEASHA
jgi:dTDP-4-dehydrorhamnose reductase